MSLLRHQFRAAVELAERIEPTPPNTFNATFGVVWLGVQEGDLLEVEIKNQHGELGLLYSSAKMVAFERNTQLLGFDRKDLKALCEHCLKDKIYIDAEVEPSHGVIKRVDNKVLGYINFDVLRPAISTL